MNPTLDGFLPVPLPGRSRGKRGTTWTHPDPPNLAIGVSTMSFNRPVIEHFTHSRVSIYYHAQRREIAFVPTEDEGPNTMAICRNGAQAHIGGTGLATALGIPRARRYPARVENGVVYVDVSETLE